MELSLCQYPVLIKDAAAVDEVTFGFRKRLFLKQRSK